MLIPLYDENPTRRFPIVTAALVAINVLIFLWEYTLPKPQLEQFFFSYGFVPQRISATFSAGDWFAASNVTIFTSMFIHANFLHVAGNMLYLWIFGNNVEDRIGRLTFILFYFVCGTIAALAQVLSDPNSALPGIGASGAVAGVLGAYLRLYPRANVIAIIPIFFFIQVVKVSAVFMLGFWIIVQFISGLVAISSGQAGGGVAWFAHIGGFIAGLIIINLIPGVWRKYSKYNNPQYR